QASSLEGRKDRRRRRHIGEGSFADACRHHFKRARWRRLSRQKLQDWLIASVQNIKILVRSSGNTPTPAENVVFKPLRCLKGASVTAESRFWLPSTGSRTSLRAILHRLLFLPTERLT